MQGFEMVQLNLFMFGQYWSPQHLNGIHILFPSGFNDNRLLPFFWCWPFGQDQFLYVSVCIFICTPHFLICFPILRYGRKPDIQDGPDVLQGIKNNGSFLQHQKQIDIPNFLAVNKQIFRKRFLSSSVVWSSSYIYLSQSGPFVHPYKGTGGTKGP